MSPQHAKVGDVCGEVITIEKLGVTEFSLDINFRQVRDMVVYVGK